MYSFNYDTLSSIQKFNTFFFFSFKLGGERKKLNFLRSFIEIESHLIFPLV